MKILCFGDSNTYGYDPCSYLGSRYSENDRWPDLLSAQTGWDIVNAGQNGREIPTHSFEMDSVTRLLNAHEPDLLLIMLGTNDLLQGLSPTAVTRRMEEFLRKLLVLGVHILLIAPPVLKRGAWVPSDTLVEASGRLGKEYADLAAKLGISFADTSRWDLQLTFDGVHMTQRDHHLFAMEMKKAVVF